MLQLIKDPKVIIVGIVLVLATIIFFYSKSTGPKPVASAVVASAALQQGANNMVLSDDQGNLSQIDFPKGIIVIWSGSQIDVPKGWALCDGEQGTPDLRGRFVVGINSDTPNTKLNNSFTKYNTGDKGGSENISIGQMPSHTHRYKDTIYMEGNSYKGGLQNFGGDDQWVGSGDTDHNNSRIGVFENTDPEGKGEKFLPPYYALAYIMKL